MCLVAIISKVPWGIPNLLTNQLLTLLTPPAGGQIKIGKDIYR